MSSEATNETLLPFKRINFFKGFFTTEHDWNDAERYHVEKRKLHQRALHTPGIVRGHAGELRVSARARNDLSIEVQPGMAIDGQGNDLVIHSPQIKSLKLEDFRLPALLYVVVTFREELTDFIAYKENLEFRGHRRVSEGVEIRVTQAVPDPRTEVELARIHVEKNVTRIRDAHDPSAPLSNEIDLRYLVFAGNCGSLLAADRRMQLSGELGGLRRLFLVLARDKKNVGAQAALAATINLEGLFAAQLIDFRNLAAFVQPLFELEGECLDELVKSEPALAQRREDGECRGELKLVSELFREPGSDAQVVRFLGHQSRIATLLGRMIGVDNGGQVAAPSAPMSGTATFASWEEVKVFSGEELPEDIAIGGVAWHRIDSINVVDRESEDAHQFQILDAKDSYRSRQKLQYPDGTVLEDVGRAHVGGSCQFNVRQVAAGKPLAVIRRIDYVYGDYELEYFVDGKSVGISDNRGTDRVHRWRNWPYVIPAEAVTRSPIVLRQVPVTAGRDINMFRYWFFQPK